MKKGHKIFNDPVYGFITIPYGLVFDLVEHPWFQRLRRIKQLGLTHYVYPGALHTRFHHALGAVHLMREAIEVLRYKGVEITDEEAEAVTCAVLLHDIGHGPFSHALEHKLIQVHHEDLTVAFMHKLNEEFGGRLQMAIDVFCGVYPKHFLHQLISGQLDMDRLDYLTRDTFFTGVHEGVIGYDRIIKMIDVRNDRLVVEEKGIYSIEKFLTARRLMYWQAYLHKTVLCAEVMLIKAIVRARELTDAGTVLPASSSLQYFLQNKITSDDLSARRDELLERFAALDDYDIFMALKEWMFCEDPVLKLLATGIINRRLFKVEQQLYPFDPAHVEEVKANIIKRYPEMTSQLGYLLIQTKESNSSYNMEKDEILVLYKNGTTAPVSEWLEHNIHPGKVTKYYLCYPKR